MFRRRRVKRRGCLNRIFGAYTPYGFGGRGFFKTQICYWLAPIECAHTGKYTVKDDGRCAGYNENHSSFLTFSFNCVVIAVSVRTTNVDEWISISAIMIIFFAIFRAERRRQMYTAYGAEHYCQRRADLPSVRTVYCLHKSRTSFRKRLRLSRLRCRRSNGQFPSFPPYRSDTRDAATIRRETDNPRDSINKTTRRNVRP